MAPLTPTTATSSSPSTRCRGNPNVADTAETVLLTIEHSSQGNHNGGMIAFDPTGTCASASATVAAGNDPPNNAQNINTLLGKILRIDVDLPNPPALYSSPPSNPYVGVAGRDEIFSIGWRNPWRFSFDRDTGQQWVADVGQDAREEVDTPILNGGNYGWRVFEGIACKPRPASISRCAFPPTTCSPIFDYTHSGGRCSITGGYVYRGTQNALPLGTYVYGDYCTGEIFSWNGTSQTVQLDTTMGISSFGEDEQGELYVVNLNGTVSKIVSSGGADADAEPPTADCRLGRRRRRRRRRRGRRTPTAAPPTATPTRPRRRRRRRRGRRRRPRVHVQHLADLGVLPQLGGSGSVAVTTGVGCGWTAVSNVPWITITGRWPAAATAR